MRASLPPRLNAKFAVPAVTPNPLAVAEREPSAGVGRVFAMLRSIGIPSSNSNSVDGAKVPALPVK